MSDDRPYPEPFVFWSRWITARRLAALRVADPDRIASMERLAAIAGFNIQLDEVA